MAALHRDWLDSDAADAPAAIATLESLRGQANAYEQVVAAEREHLTERGRRFSKATAAVAAYGLRAR